MPRSLIFNFPSLITAHSNPLDSNNDDDDYLGDKSDDYDEDEEFDDDDKKVATGSSTTVAEEPYKIQDYTEKTDIGRTINLRCLGENLDESTLFMWYNGTTIIVQGQTKIIRDKHNDKRISFSNKDGLLTIRDVSSYDDGTFRCRAFSKSGERYETIIQVKVNGPPLDIHIGHNINEQSNIADRTLVYHAGENNLRFKCNVAKARPEAKIDWIHNGNTILESQQRDHDLKVEDEGVLVIKTLHARHAGDYLCEASNEFGNLKASFKIDVQCELHAVPLLELLILNNNFFQIRRSSCITTATLTQKKVAMLS